MKEFVFEARQKGVLLGGIALGVLCMAITLFGGGDDELHSRFWSNFLHNSVFFTGIAFISLFITAAFITAWSGWHTVIKRIWEAYSLFLIPGLILMLVVVAGLWGGFNHLYHWADTSVVETDEILQGKSSFLNKGWFTAGTLLIVGIWIFFAWKLRQLSVEEDSKGGDSDFSLHRKMRWYSAFFLPIAGFSSAAIIWQWLMSIDSHWYSTLYAWYTAASWFVSAMALTIMMLIYLKSKGYFEKATAEHMHDLGKYLFAFSIFWTYLWFSQYMLIWYGNVGEETVYFHERIENYPFLFYGNLAINFVLPFFILMRNDTKRKNGTMFFTALMVFFGHWLDFFLMIKPGVLHTAHETLAHAHGGDSHGAEAAHHGGEHAAEAAHHAASAIEMGFTIPGLLELGTFVGFLSFFLYVVYAQMAKASLTPENDPYYEESLVHHT